MTRQRAILLSILLAAFLLRLWRLPDVPPGLWYDEAYYAMDAVWSAESGHYPIFYTGNNGREPMWPYLLALGTSLFGRTTFTPRLLGALIGFLTISIFYRLALVLLAPFAPYKRQGRWLALIATGWLAVSWWHLHLSRAGYRPVLLPPVLMLSLFFFWQGWRSGRPGRSLPNFVLAGLFLGLAQYTYLPARLAPLLLGGFALGWIAQSRVSLRRLWSGLLVTGLAAALVAAPLLLFFLQNPAAFSARTGDVVFEPKSLLDLAGHLLQSLALFLGAGHDELYRHHLPGRAMLGWLEIPFFWSGLAWLLARSRRRLPETQLMVTGLVVMWLPGLLASPPVHALRLVGLLPFYYLIVTLGVFLAVRWIVLAGLSRIWRDRAEGRPAKLAGYSVVGLLLTGLIALNGLINAYDYFQRWATLPVVYQENNGPLVDLTRQVMTMTDTQDILIPFHVYAHPTTRYMLSARFREVTDQPANIRRPLEMLIVPDTFQLLYVGNLPVSPAMVLLTRDEAGRGQAYVSRPPRASEQARLNELLASLQPSFKPFEDRFGRTVAQFTSFPPQANEFIETLFETTPGRLASLTWGQTEPLLRLDGYEVTPEVVRPGSPLTVNFYWRSLTDHTFDKRLFLQVIDSAGNPVNQWEGAALQEDMYRWRPAGLLPSQHVLWLGPATPPGPYLIRLGFFDDRSGERLPVRITAKRDEGEGRAGSDEAAPMDQVQLGLFYVSADGSGPRQPAIPLSAAFGNVIQLTGVTLPSLLDDQTQVTTDRNLPVTFHWQALRPTDRPYTAFLQLLDEQGQVVTSWDNQPYTGLYPTSLWSPGEMIVDTFQLPLPETGLSPGNYRLITGFYDVNTGQRLPVTLPAEGKDWVELAAFTVGES